MTNRIAGGKKAWNKFGNEVWKFIRTRSSRVSQQTLANILVREDVLTDVVRRIDDRVLMMELDAKYPGVIKHLSPGWIIERDVPTPTFAVDELEFVPYLQPDTGLMSMYRMMEFARKIGADRFGLAAAHQLLKYHCLIPVEVRGCLIVLPGSSIRLSPMLQGASTVCLRFHHYMPDPEDRWQEGMLRAEIGDELADQIITDGGRWHLSLESYQYWPGNGRLLRLKTK